MSVRRSLGFLTRSADRLAAFQRLAAGALVVAATALILLNVVTRAMGQALFWVDELAIYCMVWSFFIGAISTIRTREMIAVNLLQGMVSARSARWLQAFIDVTVFVFSLFLLHWCWIWYDPLLVIRSGFDGATFVQSSFNFIYRDPTDTLGINKAWVWSVIPLAATFAFIHASANLVSGFSTPDTGKDSDGGR